MYLSKGHMTYTAVMAGMQLVLGLPLTFILLLMGLTDFEYFSDDIEEFLPFIIEFGFITWLGVRNIRNFRYASKFNRVFTESGFGSMTSAEAAGKLNISETVCLKRFDLLTRYGLLKHCHYECETCGRFVLHKKQTDDFRGIFIVVLQMIAFFGIGLSGFFLFIMIFGLLSELLSYGLEYMDGYGIIFGITLFFIGMMAGCLKIRNVIGRAYRFSNYLSGNAGRAVPAAQTARAFAITEQAAVKEFSTLSRWGLLTGWFLQETPIAKFLPRQLMAQEPAREEFTPKHAEVQHAPEYAAVNCPNCAASLNLEVGKVEQCPYCDSWLKV